MRLKAAHIGAFSSAAAARGSRAGMKIIDRYIGRTIIGGVVTVIGVLVAIFSFFTFVDELEDVGKGTYGIGQILIYVALSMPRLAYELFPVAALIGSLMGLSLLVSGSEITVMRAAGRSPAYLHPVRPAGQAWTEAARFR